jgi:hypothetical protein
MTKLHTIGTISRTTYFETQRDMAEFLGIRSADKKSILRVAQRDGYEVQFDE